jgi:ferric enterobactin receptor
MGRARFLMILLVALFLLGLFGALVFGQTPTGEAKAAKMASVTGSITDPEGLPLPGVSVWVKGTTIRAETDEYGRYALADAPPGSWTIVASLPSFQTSETSVTLTAGQTITHNLTLEVGQLNYEVTVGDDTPKLMEASESIGVMSVSPRQMATLPSLGEKDLFRSLQFMPGVSASNESSSGLYVRGGTPDQNLVQFDHFTVYNVDHFYGIFSAFNAQAVDSITMHKGGFESKFGGRISSVVELDGRKANSEEVAFGGGLSLLSYNGYSEIPLGRKASLLVAGRKSFPSPLSHRIRDSYTTSQQGGGPGGGGPGGGLVTQPDSTFYDANARLSYDIGRRDRFVLSLYNGKDNLDSSRDMSLPSGFGEQTNPITGEITNISRWGNTGASANWWHQWNDILSSSFTLAHSRYFRDRDRRSTMTMTDPDTEEETTSERGSAEGNRLTDVSVLLDNSLVLGYRHLIEFGAQATRNRIGYSFEMAEAESSMSRNQMGTQYATYVQDRWSPFLRFSVTPGLRTTYYDRSKRVYLEPRLSFMWHASDRLRFKGAGGLYYQYANNLVREDVLEGDQDFWTLGDGKTVPVSSAVHGILGVSYETDNYLFDVEAYRKELRGLAEFGAQRLNRPGGWGPPPGGGLPPEPPEGQESRGPIDFTELFFTGKGRAEGIEFLLQKKFGAHVGWLTYSLGRVRHYFPELSDTWYPASHDSTHEVKLVDTWRYRRWLISGTWVFATGKPITAPTGVEEITLSDDFTISVPVFGGKNAARLPDYHRLDASVSRDLYVGERSRATAGLSVFNAYNRSNVWRREYDVFEEELIPTDVNYLGLTVSAFFNVDIFVPSEQRRAGPAWKPTESAGAQSASEASVASGGEAKKKSRRPVRSFDFYGTVETMTPTQLTVAARWGSRSFAVNEATITGREDYPAGTPVHVYYKREAGQDLVTMVVRKVD